MGEILGLGFFVLIVFILFIFPNLLTVINVIKLIETMSSKSILSKKWQTRFYNIDFLTIGIGVIYHLVIWAIMGFKDFSEPIVINKDFANLHSPIQYSHMLTINVFFLMGFISYIFLRIKRTKVSPLIYVISLGFIFLADILYILIIIQLSKNLSIDAYSSLIIIDPIHYMMLLPFNFLILSIILIRQLNFEYSTKIFNKGYKNRFIQLVNEIILKSNNWTLIAFILSFPILVIMVMILILFGQQPDSVIKAFTETSDWTLSQQISPPPVVYEFDSHYLCTVSLQGHRKIVKPKRYGLRRGEKIVVNRQLMIANAFEEMIQEKMPETHKWIRYIYDKYGFPLSKLIRTQTSADIVYILMKPLEYVFLISLYFVDINPENRIQKQYLPIRHI